MSVSIAMRGENLREFRDETGEIGVRLAFRAKSEFDSPSAMMTNKALSNSPTCLCTRQTGSVLRWAA
jgi:hypothetical protein